MSVNSGLIYVFTGEGKGKTSAALGVATRALLLRKEVAWISFYKEESWGMAEKGLRDKFANLEMEFVGKGFMIKKPLRQNINTKLKIVKIGKSGGVVVDKASEKEHKAAALEGLRLAEQILQKSDPCFLLILDEILNAVAEGLVDERAVLEILGLRGGVHVILTGRGLTKNLEEVADLVTECRKIKHPYDTGQLAIQGLDF